MKMTSMKHTALRMAGLEGRKGFTLLFGILVMGLLIAVAMTIVGLTLRQIIISGFSKESQIAFYAADSIVECVKYYDNRSRFADVANMADGNITCNNQTYSFTKSTISCATNNANRDFYCPKVEDSDDTKVYWKISFSPQLIGAGIKPQAKVTLVKEEESFGVNGKSTLTVDGRNTDDTGTARRVERTLKLTYAPRQSCLKDSDIMLVVDVSGSICSNDGSGDSNCAVMSDPETGIRQRLIELGDLLTNAPTTNNRVGLIAFSSHVRRFHPFVDSSGLNSFNLGVDSLRSFGGTHIPLALRYAFHAFRNEFESPDAGGDTIYIPTQRMYSPFGPVEDEETMGNSSERTNIVVLFTDGGNKGLFATETTPDDPSSSDVFSETDSPGGRICGDDGNPNCFRRDELNAVVDARNLLINDLPLEGPTTGLASGKRRTEIYTVFVNANEANDDFDRCKKRADGSFDPEGNCGDFLRDEIASKPSNHMNLSDFDIAPFVLRLTCP